MMKQLNQTFNVANSLVGGNSPPYFIAEAGSNFDQDLERARELIDIASEAGADAIKFQLFQADVLFPDGGETHAAFKSVELNPNWIPTLAQHASDIGITFLASSFDRDSVAVLEDVDVAAHKIASSEATNLPLIDEIAGTGKPIFLSTGMCDVVDIQETVNRCLARDNPNIALLQCGAMYPLPPEHANLRVMDLFEKMFGAPIGFSDHSLGSALTLAATARGAQVIEKHFTHSRSAEGPDHFYALEPDELKTLIADTKAVFAGLGNSMKDLLPAEREFGRREGLYARMELAADHVITEGDIETRRPALGLRARQLQAVVGMRTTRNILAGTPLTWNDLK